MKKVNRCWELFAAFFKIGLFTFGGGYAMISMILSELSEKKKWIDADELMDVVAIAESTPGPIAINSATYIGYKQAGFAGSLSATLGVVLPSFFIIYMISLCVDWFMAFRAVQSAFKGVQAAVAILILRAGLKLAAKVERKGIPMLCMTAAAAVLLMVDFGVLNLSSLWLIFAGAAVGLATLPIKGEKKDD